MRLGVQCVLVAWSGDQPKFPWKIVDRARYEMWVPVINIHWLEVRHNHSHNLEADLVDVGRRYINANDVCYERPDLIQCRPEIDDWISSCCIPQFIKSNYLGRLGQERDRGTKTRIDRVSQAVLSKVVVTSL